MIVTLRIFLYTRSPIVGVSGIYRGIVSGGAVAPGMRNRFGAHPGCFSRARDLGGLLEAAVSARKEPPDT